MQEARSKRLGVLAVAAGAALVVLVLVAMVLALETVQAPLPTPTSFPASLADPPVATVNGEPIGRQFWAQMVLVDRVMSGLAGVVAPAPEETLERLINEVLLLQAAPPQPAATQEEVEARIADLEAAWGRSDAQVTAALASADLERGVLAEVIARLLLVQRAQEAIEASGTPIEDWLAQQRQRAQIVVHQEQVEFVRAWLPPAPTSMPPTSAPQSTSAEAPDFSLEWSGGTLTLSDLLAEGPVVLVFFQRCG